MFGKNIYFTFFVSVYLIGSQTRPCINLEAAWLHKFKGICNDALLRSGYEIVLRAIKMLLIIIYNYLFKIYLRVKYLFTACHSDNSLFHKNLV